MSDETIFWIAWWSIVVMTPLNILLMWLSGRRERRVREMLRELQDEDA